MFQIPFGSYEIQCVLLNSETVLNNEGIRRLEIDDRQWAIEPAGQKFEVTQMSHKNAVLKSNDQVYFADFSMVSEDTVLIELKRERVNETISIEAQLVRSEVHVV